jgi:hypothetical protein
MEYVNRDHANHVLYRWDKLEVVKEPGGNPLIFLDLDTPLPECLLDRPDWDVEVGGYRLGVQDWDVGHTLNDDGDIIQITLTYTGKDRRNYERARRAQIKITKPRSPGRFYKVEPGQTHVMLVRSCLQEEPPDEITCPKCEAELFPVPDVCPQCGEKLTQEVPTVGELADTYGRDAVVGVHIGSMDADLMLTYERTKAQADEANKKGRAVHDEKAAAYKEKTAAWNKLIEPHKRKRKADQEVRERQELERLQSKYPDAGA